MNIYEKIKRFVEQVFKTTLEIFLEALKLSPNAQGYVSGSITELLLKKKLEEEYNFEVKRIREKWEGKKHPQHHGDFYFRKQGTHYWYVIESKGLKSNSEKWHRLYNFQNLKNFLITHADKIPWIDTNRNIEEQVIDWIHENLPKFQNEYLYNLYEYEEVQKYVTKRKTKKAEAIDRLRSYTRDQISNMIEERLNYVMSKVKVLETHFVSGRSGVSERTQATPRKDEFNIIAIDIVLRYPEHKFLFANPQNLESSGDDPNHLQQNYVMGFVFIDEQGEPTLHISEDWYEDLNEVYNTLDPKDAVNEDDMQVDNRYMIAEEEKED
ncbi:hypothetical protein DRP98_07930 [candidate division KSB1 bacterium]|nr:MAG: hypothetical protein DRP98_07930 [candidate division KSB1 bacterium]